MGDCGLNSNNVNMDYIKVYNASFVGVAGSNIEHSMPINLFSPYKQILRGSIRLKAGQCKYLLNHLGLGDNATFLAITATYDNASRIEADNFVQYSNYTTPNNWNSFAQMMVLTGNSENRVEQLYLTNPNQQYAVKLDIMVGIIDEEYNFLDSSLGGCDEIASNSMVKFINVTCEDIVTWSVGTIAILDVAGNPQIYIDPFNINSLKRNGNEITIDDNTSGTIIIAFTISTHNGILRTAVEEAISGYSKLSAVIENNNLELTNSMCHDKTPPCITFTDKVAPSGMSYSVIQTTCDGSGTIDYYTPDDITATLNFDKSEISTYIIDNCNDIIDGDITLGDDNIIINELRGGEYSPISIITTSGTYYITFYVSDLMGNSVNNDINIKISVIIN